MSDEFAYRHIGPRASERDAMLAAIGTPTLDALIDEAIPASIRLATPLSLPPAETEHAYLTRLRTIAARNRIFRSYIGLGYHDTVTPPVIQRTVFENPSWYTPYTPYQAEVAQGRLEALLNYQTMVRDLTGMDIANASLLDEPTAAGEAMTLLRRVSKKPAGAMVFLVSERVFPQTLAVLQSRATPLGIVLRVAAPADMVWADDVFGVLLQSPDANGAVDDLSPLIARAHEAGVLVAVATDLLSLALLTPAGEMGADVVLGSAQRFGVPMGYGGPHAGFFATRGGFVRQMPGRVIGLSVDATGQPAYRMALQTREQHIRREKATSNICTAQALLANMAGFYGVYHGPEGLTRIARTVHRRAAALEQALGTLGLGQVNPAYFDTLKIDVGTEDRRDRVRDEALASGINFRDFDTPHVGIALDETTTERDLDDIVAVFARALGRKPPEVVAVERDRIPPVLARTSTFMTHPVFSAHHSETAMMRYVKALERKDVGLDTSMIALGSCTMKLNAAAEMLPVTWPEFGKLHPFAPADQAAGYAQIIEELEAALREITGFAAISLQPNSGAQGELTGLLVIRAWHADRGEGHRNVVLIPSSAHGTNPASGVMAGMRVVVVACDEAGNVDVADLRRKAGEHAGALRRADGHLSLEHGVFLEDAIREICDIVHQHGGQCMTAPT